VVRLVTFSECVLLNNRVQLEGERPLRPEKRANRQSPPEISQSCAGVAARTWLRKNNKTVVPGCPGIVMSLAPTATARRMTSHEKITLTILMPCLNEARTLPICIAKARSYIARQSFRSEIVIADNGSDDGSRELAERGPRLDRPHRLPADGQERRVAIVSGRPHQRLIGCKIIPTPAD
jgi:hypothetical protein